MADDAREIEQLVLSYATFADGGQPEQLITLFADDGEIRVGGRSFAGRDRLTKFFSVAPRDVHKTKHVLTNIVIDQDADDLANSVTYFQVLNTTGLQAWGRYIDRFRKHDGKWQIAVREVAIDGPAPAE
jgi:uncharacterized protein (TIGR02246 family)